MVKHFISYLCIIYYALFAVPSFSQTNLVPNPSFEDTIACPLHAGQLNYATFWRNPTMASPDYMNACNIGSFGVPINYIGVQNAHTGKAYAFIGVYCFCGGSSNNFREYIQVPLNLALKMGETYYAEFYVSLSNGVASAYAVNNLGAYFSDTAVSSADKDPLPYLPQVLNSSTNPLTNISVWTKVSGQFIARGGEHYLTIGNFNDNATSDTVFIKQTTQSFKESDYYIDDVSVMHLNAEAGRDTAICEGDSIMLGRITSNDLIYSWQPSIGLSNPNIAQPIATPTVTTTYYLTATLNGSCAKQDTITITVVNADAGKDTSLCEGSEVRLGETPIKGVSYDWQPISGLDSYNIAQPIAAPSKTTTYTLTTMTSGCILKDTVTVNILPYKIPIAKAGTSQTICIGDTILIGETEMAGYKYSWSPSLSLINSYSSQPSAFPKQTTTYFLTVTDTATAYLCKTSISDSVLITVDDCLPILPNVFTPNSDGINDEFIISNLPLESNVIIYNRWGQEIINYKLRDKNWYGEDYSGTTCMEGVYYYIVSLPNGKAYKSSLELMR